LVGFLTRYLDCFFFLGLRLLTILISKAEVLTKLA
jgi:hypothetical protein